MSKKELKLTNGLCKYISPELQAAIEKSGYKFMHNSGQHGRSMDCFSNPFMTVASDSVDIILSAIISMAVGVKEEGEEVVIDYDKNDPLIIIWRREPSINSGSDYDRPDFYSMRLTCYTKAQYEGKLNNTFIRFSCIRCRAREEEDYEQER